MLDQFSRTVGSPPAIVMWYQDWEQPGVREFDLAKMNAVRNRNAMPMVTWKPWDDHGGMTQPAYRLQAIAAGSHDAFLRQWARAAAQWGNPFYLRFAPEMNGNWFPWSAGMNGNTAADYVAAWRHVVTLFRSEGATNVSWVWCPNVDRGGMPFGNLYPGDAYVDWLALDGYNWGTSTPTNPFYRWETVVEIFADSYRVITQLSSKPLMFAEIASTELGGDKAQWITQGLLADLPSHFPRVRAVVWFHEDKETDWRVNSSSRSLAAYQTVVASSIYRAPAPTPRPQPPRR